MQKYDRFLQKSVEQKNSRSLEKKIVGIIRRDNFFFFFFRFSIVSWFYRNILFETTKCRCVRKYSINIERKLKEVVINLRNGTFRTTH